MLTDTKSKIMKQKIRTLFMMLVMLTASIGAWAATETTLVLWMNDGGQAVFAFSNRPKVQVGKDSVVVSSDADSVSYVISNVRKATFGKQTTTGIDAIKADNVSIEQQNGRLQMRSLEPNSSVSVYSISGKLVGQAVSDGNGNVSLDGMSRGIYIIKSKNITFKMIKR